MHYLTLYTFITSKRKSITSNSTWDRYIHFLALLLQDLLELICVLKDHGAFLVVVTGVWEHGVKVHQQGLLRRVLVSKKRGEKEKKISTQKWTNNLKQIAERIFSELSCLGTRVLLQVTIKRKERGIKINEYHTYNYWESGNIGLHESQV